MLLTQIIERTKTVDLEAHSPLLAVTQIITIVVVVASLIAVIYLYLLLVKYLRLRINKLKEES